MTRDNYPTRTQRKAMGVSVDMEDELQKTVHHLCGMLRTVKRLRPRSPAAAVSATLEKHLKALRPADVGLPDMWSPDAANALCAKF